mgnify:CR=1 FL=1
MELLYALESIRTPFLDKLMGLVTNLGGEAVFIAAAIIVFWCLNKSCGYYMMTVGFAGTIQAFVPDALVKRYCAAMEALFGPGCCYLLSLREQGAVRVM